MFEISDISNLTINTIEVNKNHIHLLLDIESKISVTSFVNHLKFISTNRLQKRYKNYLKTHF
jgi:REP element-mobilizing transposase RayT